MLLRSSSSRRRRASRSAASSPQAQTGGTSGAAISPRARRASVATDKGISLTINNTTTEGMDRQRSPRGSVVPNISLDTSDNHEEPIGRRILPDPELCGSTRGLVAESNRSGRNSLDPEDYFRNSSSRSPRNSLRNSRHSLLPEISPSQGNIEFDRRASRSGSICPELMINRSPRSSVANIDFDRGHSPRGSINSIVHNIDSNRSRAGSITSEYHNTNLRATPYDIANRSPRGSIAVPEFDRNSRGSIGEDIANRSPRGSIAVPEFDRNARGSIGEDVANRSPRGSIGVPEYDRNSRGSIGEDTANRSPRSSLSGHESRRTHRGNSITIHEPRRASADQGLSGNRNSSPYYRDGSTGNTRSGNYGTQGNLSYGTNAWVDSRRASSSISQASGDESRRLCMRSVNTTEKGVSSSSNLGVATYGSLVFQLKDAHREASGTCDFVFRGMRVISKTMVVTICLGCLSTMPIIMLIIGLQFVKDCPKEPNIPVYMIVGGSLGGVRMFWALYSQIRSRRLEILSEPATRPYISPMQLVSIALTCFLSVWFVLGNYWILKIRWPDFEAKMFDPNHWCAKTLYIFALVHLGIVYAFIGIGIVTALCLAVCRALACPWFERYK